MTIDWFISILTDDGFTIFESDAVVEYSVSWQFGERIVEVDSFEIEASRRSSSDPHQWEQRALPAHFSAHAKQPWAKLLFFHVKENLEADQAFIDAVLRQEDLWSDAPARPRTPHAFNMSEYLERLTR